MNGKVGLGFRRELADELLEHGGFKPAFLEFSPENWMNIGGYWKTVLKKAVAKYPVVCHGLSLSIGSPDPLDVGFVKRLKSFLDENEVLLYSEHLSYSKAQNAHLYDLLPIPFREDAIVHIVERIGKAQDLLGRKIALENVSYYTPVAAEMDEATFISEIVSRADCNLLLDVNNVYVNAFNHNYMPEAFIKKLPLDRVSYIHMAGHEKVAEDLIIDTHGQPIIDPVFNLFEFTLQHVKPVPVLLERDFNIPEIAELEAEVGALQKLCDNAWKTSYATN
jgi:uncharacterized protein (UPF0276 family)